MTLVIKKAPKNKATPNLYHSIGQEWEQVPAVIPYGVVKGLILYLIQMHNNRGAPGNEFIQREFMLADDMSGSQGLYCEIRPYFFSGRMENDSGTNYI